MYFLEISKANDFDFFVVCLIYGAGILIATCLIMGFIEWVAESRERRKRMKRNKYRNRYVDIRTNWRY
ncbi:MAG: hypothetical protein J6S23_02425 [Clostridia bacterium]|nr:hypothetical protein [Clostridia bacterium]